MPYIVALSDVNDPAKITYMFPIVHSTLATAKLELNNIVYSKAQAGINALGIPRVYEMYAYAGGLHMTEVVDQKPEIRKPFGEWVLVDTMTPFYTDESALRRAALSRMCELEGAPVYAARLYSKYSINIAKEDYKP